MGTGFYKLASTNKCVESKHKSIYEIDLMDFERNLINFEHLKGKKVLFVTLASGNKRNESFLQDISSKMNEFEQNNIKVVGLATNTHSHENKSFTEQKEYYSRYSIPVFPHVEINGNFSHAIIKFLKRKSQLYDYDLLDAPVLRTDHNMVR